MKTWRQEQLLSVMILVHRVKYVWMLVLIILQDIINKLPRPFPTANTCYTLIAFMLPKIKVYQVYKETIQKSDYPSTGFQAFRCTDAFTDIHMSQMLHFKNRTKLQQANVLIHSNVQLIHVYL